MGKLLDAFRLVGKINSNCLKGFYMLKLSLCRLRHSVMVVSMVGGFFDPCLLQGHNFPNQSIMAHLLTL